MNDILVGTLIGGSIAFLSSIVPLFITLNYDQRKRNYERKESVYLQVINVITKYRTELPNSSNDKVSVSHELAREYNETYSLMIIHSTDKIHQAFSDLIADIISSKKISDEHELENINKKMNTFNALLISDLENENKFMLKMCRKRN
jgi:hypothetical protein